MAARYIVDTLAGEPAAPSFDVRIMQNRQIEQPYGDLVRPASLWDATTATGDNFLALKISYWLPLL